MIAPRLLAPALLLLGSASLAAQDRLDAVDYAERLRVRSIVGDLGGPELAPLLADSPLDVLDFADRVPVVSRYVPPNPALLPPTYVQGLVPAGPGGTGTDKDELFWYQVPGGYDAGGPAVPLLIAYHGYGSSANSVATETSLDEECNARGWLYVAPTGIDDQLFGSPVSQANTASAVQWMLDHYHVDANRIYMVGFSMGGGITANFTAHRRDPGSWMIAAIGIVSGTFDWTMSWTMGTPSLKTWLENAYNFNGTPAAQAFAYQRSSGLYFTAGTYPPLPGTLDASLSMAVNLGSTPTFVTWDLADTLPEVRKQEPVFTSLMASLGGVIESHPVTGTPVTHSWDVLNEPLLFDFFAQHTLDRAPASFHALADGDVAVSWATLLQHTPQSFSRLDGAAALGPATLAVTGLDNLAQLALHADLAGIPGPGPLRVVAGSVDSTPTLLRYDGLGAPPAWFADTATGALLPGDSSDPVSNALLFPLLAGATWQADLVTQPLWTTDVVGSPAIVPHGALLTLSLDAPAGLGPAFLLAALDEGLATVKGAPLTVALAGPLLVLPLALDSAGDAQLAGSVPDDAALAGLDVCFQSVAFGAGPKIASVSNLWRTTID
jgi:acetyl esterase/lipase